MPPRYPFERSFLRFSLSQGAPASGPIGSKCLSLQQQVLHLARHIGRALASHEFWRSRLEHSAARTRMLVAHSMCPQIVNAASNMSKRSERGTRSYSSSNHPRGSSKWIVASSSACRVWDPVDQRDRGSRAHVLSATSRPARRMKARCVRERVLLPPVEERPGRDVDDVTGAPEQFGNRPHPTSVPARDESAALQPFAPPFQRFRWPRGIHSPAPNVTKEHLVVRHP